ncbi:hypothetical protein ACMFMG_009428 [Clarireedia jacksonii]
MAEQLNPPKPAAAESLIYRAAAPDSEGSRYLYNEQYERDHYDDDVSTIEISQEEIQARLAEIQAEMEIGRRERGEGELGKPADAQVREAGRARPVLQTEKK